VRWRIYHGVWGTAPFQSLYEPARGDVNTLLLMPEIYLAIGILALLVALGATWAPLFGLAPVLLIATGSLALRSVVSATRARFPTPGLAPSQIAVRRALSALLHVAQPLVRLEGRMRHGLTPWRRFAVLGRALPVARRLEVWSEEWSDPVEWVRRLERDIGAAGAVVRRGGEFDGWDLEIRGGVFAGVRVLSAVEEHGSGRQLFRARCRPKWSPAAVSLALALIVVAVTAAADQATATAVVLGLSALALALRILAEASSALALTTHVVAGAVGGRAVPEALAAGDPG
jgi:hypothetical protein